MEMPMIGNLLVQWYSPTCGYKVSKRTMKRRESREWRQHMPQPDIRDVHARTVDTATRNDERQYAQSTFGHFSDSDRGHKQGQYNDWMQVQLQGPFEQQMTTGDEELQIEISETVFDQPIDLLEPREQGDLTGFEPDPYDNGDGDDGFANV